MKTNTIISLTASAILLVCSAAPVYAGTPWLHTDGNQIKDPMGNVVILRGVDFIDLGFLDNWHGGAIAMIDRLTDKTDTQGNSPGWYPKVFRINITPPDSVGYGWPVPFDPTNCSFYYDLLRPVVDYCKSKDVYVIIDWHYVANTYDHVDSTSQFWEYIAPKFANDSHVLFELFNEPMNDLYNDWIFNNTDVNDWLSVRQDMQTWVNIVRTYAPKNLILVAGSNYAQILKPIVDNPIDGNNIVYVSHIYPGHFYNWWWSNSYQYFGRSYQDEITSCAAVYPVMMTEWGFSQSNNPDPTDQLNGTITQYGQPLMDFIEGLGISNSAWVASYNWGPPMFFNPDPNNWSNPPGPWPLRIGEGEMGGFVKDTLYAKRNANQPCGGKIVLSSPSLNFGEIELGKSQVLTVGISNTGCAPLTISGAGIKTDFAFTSLLLSSTTIQPGETLNMETAYSPTVYGNNSAVLQINSSDANNPVVQIPLSAKGILSPLSPGKIGVSPTSFNFGEITLGQSTGLTVHISNTGSGPLIITGIGINTDFAFASLPPLSTTIQPGETLNMETAYSPTAYGNNSAVLQINSSDASTPVVQIPLSAKGVLSSLTPSSQITGILALFDEYVKEGSLQWVSKNSSRPDYHLNILRNMIQSAQSSINRGKSTLACRQLTKVQKYFNSTNTSSDHVEGAGTVNMADAIQKLMQTLGCK
ncbi:MAG: cellulase family glycosylhydrolase [Sedimentisphaerales bacterium]|jgi:endoglucanase